jgi:hypothetical protein
VEKAVSKVPDTKAEVDQHAGTVTLRGPDAATVQQAADALVAGGGISEKSARGMSSSPTRPVPRARR